MPERFPLAPFTRGLSTLADISAGDPRALSECYDVRGHTGILTLRRGFRILDIEPSHVATASGNTKARGDLRFDGTNDYAYNTSWSQQLGTKWTIRWETSFLLADNATTGTRTMLLLYDGSNVVVKLEAIGVTAAATIQLQATIRDSAGTSIVLTSAARTIVDWQTAGPYASARYIRIVRDEDTCYLYVAETLEDSDTGLGTTAHNQATAIYVGADQTPANYSDLQVFGSLVIVNRVLDEEDCYWGIHYPTDNEAEIDILGNWPFLEMTGTTIADYSANGKDLTISGATWEDSNHTAARGLGIFSWRRSNGDLYYFVASTRRGTSNAGAAPSGAIYSWKATQAFFPFYFGGDPGNDDATASASGYAPFARFTLAQGRDMAIFGNGVDHLWKIRTAIQYAGGTAPPTAPVVVTSGGSGITATWIYAYSYFNSATKTETGLSPSTTISITDDVGTSINWFPSSDTQFNYVRIYRSRNGETALYLLTEQAMGTGGPYADTKTDANLVAGPLCPGSDIPGNRARKRAYLGFPDFRQDDPVEGTRRGPVSAPTLAESGSASVDAGVHYFAYSYYDSTNDVETGMSPAAAITATGAMQVDVSALVLPPEGSRYNQMRLYRTKAGAFVWYLAQTFNVSTTATETQADSALTSTIETRCLPPIMTGLTPFANRLWGFNGDRLWWSTMGFLEDFPEANGFSPKAGVHIRALSATDGGLFVHFEDGTIYLMPHPGDEADITLFVPLALRQWSPKGAAIGHQVVQSVPGGLIWLALDGFYFANPSTLELISPQIGPDFLNLNAARGPYACSMYDHINNIYRCWVSRGDKRLNEECFVYYINEKTWWLDTTHADAAGVLYDAKENPHFCFLVENGVLCELDDTMDQDGDGDGTLSGTVTSPGITRFASTSGYTPPDGGGGGYPLWFVKSDGTTVQRWRLDNALSVQAMNFYPSYSGLTSGSWTVYHHGIRGYFKTMMFHLGDMRYAKNIHAIFFFNRVAAAGGLQVNLSQDEGAFTAVNQDVDLTKAVSQVTPVSGSCRTLRFEVYSDPPAADKHYGLKGMEIEATVDTGDTGT